MVEISPKCCTAGALSDFCSENVSLARSLYADLQTSERRAELVVAMANELKARAIADALGADAIVGDDVDAQMIGELVPIRGLDVTWLFESRHGAACSILYFRQNITPPGAVIQAGDENHERNRTAHT